MWMFSALLILTVRYEQFKAEEQSKLKDKLAAEKKNAHREEWAAVDRHRDAIAQIKSEEKQQAQVRARARARAISSVLAAGFFRSCLPRSIVVG